MITPQPQDQAQLSREAFACLSPGIQAYVRSLGWSELRPIQSAAIRALLAADAEGGWKNPDHLLITSGTASGKTEAAFLPAASALERDPSSSVGILYVAPLKALINDQQERLIPMMEAAGLKVTSWHGDRSQGSKDRLLKSPEGLLQITPESLEGLLLRRPGEVCRLFGDLRFIVIDEVHAFMGDERGRQLQCLIERIDRQVKAKPRPEGIPERWWGGTQRIGLSATVGDTDQAARWLAGTSARPVHVIHSTSSGRRIRLSLDHHELSQPCPLDPDPMAEVHAKIYQQVRGRRALVFRQSRREVEETAVSLRSIAKEQGEADIFRVHHGSVSAAWRQEAEEAMRSSSGPAVTVATVTLELGIDLGSLERVVQVGPPPSVSSLVQRLGRTGRRGQGGEMAFHTTEEAPEQNAAPHEQLPWDLLVAIAEIQLYLEERWVEDARAPVLPLSLLTHQAISLIGAQGQLPAAELARQLLTLPPFRQVGQPRLQVLLRHLIEKDILQRDEPQGGRPGELMLGVAGGRLAHDWHFLAVFEGAAEVPVYSGGEQVGSLSELPATGEVIALAGRNWQVIATDEQRRSAYVRPTKARRTVSWKSPGQAQRHPRVAERARRLLSQDDLPPYLSRAAADRLQRARTTARMAGLDRVDLHSLGVGMSLLLPWCGDRLQRSLGALLSLAMPQARVELGEGWTLRIGAPPQEVRAACAALPPIAGLREALIQARMQGELQPLEKFDHLVPRELLAEAFVDDELDLQAAAQLLRSL